MSLVKPFSTFIVWSHGVHGSQTVTAATARPMMSTRPDVPAPCAGMSCHGTHGRCVYEFILVQRPAGPLDQIDDDDDDDDDDQFVTITQMQKVQNRNYTENLSKQANSKKQDFQIWTYMNSL